MSDKKRRDITLGEMQDECKFRGDNCETVGGDRCKFFEVCATMQTIDKGCLTPIMWNLTDPPRFNEAQMAFFKPWRDIGAKWVSRDSGDPFCHEITFYNEQQQIIGYMVQTQIANGMPMQERIDLAELLGKDGAEC